MVEETVAQLPRRRLQAYALPGSMLGHILAVTEKFQPMHPSQSGNKLLIRIRLLPAQLVIEMDCRQNKPQLSAHFEQQSEERNRIDPPRNRDADALPGFQQLSPPNVGKHVVDKGVHPNMVKQRLWGDCRLGRRNRARSSLLRVLPAFTLGYSYNGLNPSSPSYSTKSAFS